LSRVLARLLSAQGRWARPFGDAVHAPVHALFHAVPALRDLLNGRWLGHPLHAALTDLPIGVLGLAVVLDLVGQPAAAGIALAFALLGMLGSALTGLADYADTDGSARTTATVHGSIMAAATLMTSGSLALRGGEGGAPIVLEAAAFGLVLAGAYVGGDVVYALGNMVDRHAWRGGGQKWIALEPAEVDEAGDIPAGRLVKAKLGINALVLVRDGESVMALHDQCAHAGGPLSGGSFADGCVECPWHGSRFRLTDGRVVRGPSVWDQPVYEVRRAAAGGWEGRRRQEP
jgi:nitrite reductase/ring-hydroxylating ferredoxin subunit